MNIARRASLICLAAIIAILWCPKAFAEDPVTDFKQNCSSCHTIGGGRLTGPDLKHVEKRKDRDWLIKFIVDPTGVLDSGDPYALKLLDEARGARMNPIAGMSRKRAEQLLDLVAVESELEKSQFAGVQISMRPFTNADVLLGRELFTGEQQLANGGAACIACHDIGGLKAFGGGRLSDKDLTKVFERYEDRRKLGTWLSAPATPTMQPTFREHPMTEDEILGLVAYFEHTAKHEQEESSNAPLIFALMGLLGAAIVLGAFNRIWAFRFRGVRKPLIKRASWEGRASAAAAPKEGTTV